MQPRPRQRYQWFGFHICLGLRTSTHLERQGGSFGHGGVRYGGGERHDITNRGVNTRYFFALYQSSEACRVKKCMLASAAAEQQTEKICVISKILPKA